MKPFLVSMILGSTILFGSYSSGESIQMTLVEIEDGDTLVALVSGEKLRLQLMSIDAPEDEANPKLMRDAERTGLAPETLLSLGALATAHMRTLVAPDQDLEVSHTLGEPDRYGRIPAVVIGPDGRSLNEAMVADGFAISMEEQQAAGSPLQSLPELEQTAIAESRGLWGSNRELTSNWYGRP